MDSGFQLWHVTLKMRQTKPHGRMKILSFIEDEEIIKKILRHLGLWDVKQRPPPKAHAPPPTVHIDYSARPARPGATHLSFVGLDYAPHQT